MKVLLVAIGRMGRRYQTVLQDYLGSELELFTVDPAYPLAESQRHFQSLKEVPDDLQFDLAIDARSNQQRLQMLQELTRRRIPKIIIEKPCAASMKESADMQRHIENLGYPVKVMSPFYRRFMEEFRPEAIQALNLGKLRTLSAVGGAIGVGCNGVHLIDLANFLLGTTPLSVLASLELDTIASPRGKEFVDLSGTLLFRYPEGKFILDVEKDSCAGVSLSMIFEQGKIVIPDQMRGSWILFQRPEAQRGEAFCQTHTDQVALEPLGEAIDLAKLMKAGISALLCGETVPDFADSHYALQAIALAIQSSAKQTVLSWDDQSAAEVSFRFT